MRKETLRRPVSVAQVSSLMYNRHAHPLYHCRSACRHFIEHAGKEVGEELIDRHDEQANNDHATMMPPIVEVAISPCCW
jgi:hypothetical protein